MCLKLERALTYDAISVIRQALAAMSRDKDNVIHNSYLRPQATNDMCCKHESDTDSESALSHWTRGPVIARYLRQVR